MIIVMSVLIKSSDFLPVSFSIRFVENFRGRDITVASEESLSEEEGNTTDGLAFALAICAQSVSVTSMTL